MRTSHLEAGEQASAQQLLLRAAQRPAHTTRRSDRASVQAVRCPSPSPPTTGPGPSCGAVWTWVRTPQSTRCPWSPRSPSKQRPALTASGLSTAGDGPDPSSEAPVDAGLGGGRPGSRPACFLGLCTHCAWKDYLFHSQWAAGPEMDEHSQTRRGAPAFSGPGPCGPAPRPPRAPLMIINGREPPV